MEETQITVKDHEWQVIVNPNACDHKCFDSWDGISAKLTESGIPHQLHKSDSCGMGIQIAKTLCNAGHRHILVVGGDGTINEVVNGILTSNATPSDVFLAVLPLGRGNDWARTHHIPSTYSECIDILHDGLFKPHDIGQVDIQRDSQPSETRYFINIAGFCFDAEVIYDVCYNKPKLGNISVYLLSLARTLFKYKSQLLSVKSPDFQYKGKTFIVTVANCQYNGGGMRQAPMANPYDGQLDVVVIPKVSRLTVIANAKGLFAGEHIKKIKKVKTYRTQELSILSSQRIRGEVEGELLNPGNYHIKILPKALNILAVRPDKH